jgi:hypothetical protein
MASRATVHCGHYSLPWEAFVARVGYAKHYDEEGRIYVDVWATNKARTLWQVEARVTDQSPVIPIDDGNWTCYDASNTTFA